MRCGGIKSLPGKIWLPPRGALRKSLGLFWSGSADNISLLHRLDHQQASRCMRVVIRFNIGVTEQPSAISTWRRPVFAMLNNLGTYSFARNIPCRVVASSDFTPHRHVKFAPLLCSHGGLHDCVLVRILSRLHWWCLGSTFVLATF